MATVHESSVFSAFTKLKIVYYSKCRYGSYYNRSLPNKVGCDTWNKVWAEG